jgi:hypothetical protein
MIVLQRGVINLHFQLNHVLGTCSFTVIGGITKFCLCEGVPHQLFIYFDRHSLKEVKMTRSNTRFFYIISIRKQHKV